MLKQIEQTFSQICNDSFCIIIPLEFESKDTILCLDLDIDVDEFENSYWGRRYDNGYHYQVCRL